MTGTNGQDTIRMWDQAHRSLCHSTDLLVSLAGESNASLAVTAARNILVLSTQTLTGLFTLCNGSWLLSIILNDGITNYSVVISNLYPPGLNASVSRVALSYLNKQLFACIPQLSGFNHVQRTLILKKFAWKCLFVWFGKSSNFLADVCSQGSFDTSSTDDLGYRIIFAPVKSSGLWWCYCSSLGCTLADICRYLPPFFFLLTPMVITLDSGAEDNLCWECWSIQVMWIVLL
jgi:hypothetical protein